MRRNKPYIYQHLQSFGHDEFDTSTMLIMIIIMLIINIYTTIKYTTLIIYRYNLYNNDLTQKICI